MSREAIREFLDSTIRNRISVRLIAEQHIALSFALARTPPAPRPDSPRETTDTGVLNPNCRPADVIKACSSYVTELCEATLGASPAVQVDGETQTTFAWVVLLAALCPSHG